MKNHWLCLALVPLLVLVGCASAESPRAVPGASITGAALAKEAAGMETLFTVPIKQVGDPIGVDFRGVLIKGNLRVQLVDNHDKVVWQQPAVTGTFAVDTTIKPQEVGEYKLGLAWDEAVQAQYSLVWRPREIQVPTVSPIAFLSGLGMMAVAVGFLIYAAYLGKHNTSGQSRWGYLLLGALAWIVTVALKFAWAIPFNSPIYRILSPLPVVGLLIFSLYVGALTGAFEVGVTYLVLRYTRLGKAPWERVIVFGIGFGAIEALLLSLSPLIAVAVAISNPNLFPLEVLENLALLNNPVQSLAPVWERFFTLWVHICSGVLIFYAVATKKPRWFWLAFLYKTLLDGVAGYAQVSGILTQDSPDLLVRVWVIELIVAAFGIAGWFGTRWVQNRYPAPA